MDLRVIYSFSLNFLLYFSQEELLHNTFTNLTPVHQTQVNINTRVCAYWSEMIGCLYPGTVTALYPNAGKQNQHLIDIEFDDGDR